MASVAMPRICEKRCSLAVSAVWLGRLAFSAGGLSALLALSVFSQAKTGIPLLSSLSGVDYSRAVVLEKVADIG